MSVPPSHAWLGDSRAYVSSMIEKRRRAFTLVELLVVVAVIALVIGLLLPALSSARKAAQLAASLNNMRQITIGALDYADANDGLWPIIGVAGRENPPDDPFALAPNASSSTDGVGMFNYCSWAFGGKSTDDRNNRIGDDGNIATPAYDMSLQNKAGQRNALGSIMDQFNFVKTGYQGSFSPHDYPGLNTYIYPELIDYYEEITLDSYAISSPDVRRELPIFECPSDNSTFQRRYTRFYGGATPEQVRDSSISTYDDVGTSYQLNLSWVGSMHTALGFEGEFGSPFDVYFAQANRYFKGGGQLVPSQFAWLKDEVADVVVAFEHEMPGMHGGTNRSKLAFVDGSVRYLQVEPGRPYTQEYAVVFRNNQSDSLILGGPPPGESSGQ